MIAAREGLASLWRSGGLGARRPSRGAAPVAIVGLVVVGLLMRASVPIGPAVVLGLTAFGLVGFVNALFPPGSRRGIGRLAAIVFVTHVAAAALLFAVSYASGRGGFYFGDDAAYDATGRLVAEYIRGTGDPQMGPPVWGGYAYLVSGYGLLVAALYTIFGSQTLSMQFLNAGLLTAAVVLLYDVVAHVFDRQKAIIAAAIAAFFPSVFVWSVLNLKDALTLFLVFGVLAALVRFRRDPRWQSLALALLALLPLVQVRLWLYYLAAVTAVVAVGMVTRLSPQSRVTATVVTALCALAILQSLASVTVAKVFAPGFLVSLAVIRQAMAGPAHSGYGGATPLPLQVAEGVTLIVITPSPPPFPTPSGTIPRTSAQPSAGVSGAPGTPSAPPTAAVQTAVVTTAPSGAPRSGAPTPGRSAGPATPTPKTIVVQPGTQLILAPTPAPDSSTPTPPPPTGAVYVDPGDRVVVLASGAAPASEGPARQVVVPDSDAITVSTSQLVSVALIQHIPLGLLYALFAPFPWVISSPLYLGVSADMLLWYVVLAAAVWGAYRERRRWPDFAPTLLLFVTIMGVFAVVEGNLGTLFRHRGIVIPLAIAIGAPALQQWLSLVRGWLGPRLGSLADRAVAQLG